MNTAKTILLSTLIFTAISQICEEPGECVDSIFLGSIPANDSADCLKKCRNINGCTYGSFTPDYKPKLCLMFQTCTKVENVLCPNCLTNEIYCPQCDVPGLCLGQILHTDTSEDKVACWSLCKSTDGCTWFSFDTGLDKICILYEDCEEIESNPQFVSGQEECEYSDMGSYLIAGGYLGYYTNDSTEVVEFDKTNSTPFYGKLPSRRESAVGAMFGNVPILCGGWNSYDRISYDNCISFQNSQWSQSHSMNMKRIYAAGIQINSTTFWILGGYDYASGSTDSTEFIIFGQNNGVSGPKLPYGLSSMCAVKFSETEIFIIGGRNQLNRASPGARNEVWIYDLQNGFARHQGPSLTEARYHHSCSTMRDGEKKLIVTAGGYYRDKNGNHHRLNSVEIYDPIDNVWHLGPPLPYGLDRSAMAEFPYGVLLFGGFGGVHNVEHQKEILKLHAGAISWKILNITLKHRRSNHVVIPLY